MRVKGGDMRVHGGRGRIGHCRHVTGGAHAHWKGDASHR